MKKVTRRIILAILALDILTATGCSKMQQGRADSFDPACDYQYQYYNTDVELGLNITEDESGCLYYLAGGYLYKYDPKTGENAPLCNKTNCLHDKETDETRFKSCNAFFPIVDDFAKSTSVVSYENGYIYIAGTVDWAYSYNTFITRIKTDGSQRQDIHEFNGQYYNSIMHRGYYYYADKAYDEDGNYSFSVKSYPLDGHGKEKTIFVPSGEMLTYEIDDFMAYGKYLYFCVSQTDKETKSTSKYRYYCLDTSTGKTAEIKVPDNEKIIRINFFNDKLIFYTENDEKDAEMGNKWYDGTPDSYEVPMYEADLDGKNQKEIPVKIQLGYNIYSDGDYLVVSNDNLLSVTDKKYIDADPEAFKEATYYVYDKNYKLVDSYTEDFKGYNSEYDIYRVYYSPLGVGETSYSLVIDPEDGSAVLYGGDKSQIGGLDGSQFKRKKLAVIAQSPAAKFGIEVSHGKPYKRF